MLNIYKKSYFIDFKQFFDNSVYALDAIKINSILKNDTVINFFGSLNH